MIDEGPAGNPPDLAARLDKLARASGAEIVATESGWVDEGVNFGSRYVVTLKKPAIALAWDRPASSTSAGWTRFVLERQFGYPVTPVRSNLLASADLSRFQVIILPDAFGEGYSQALGPAGARRLKDWVAAGGTLIGLGNAVSYMADPRAALISVRQESAPRPVDAKKPEAPKPEAGETRVPGKLLATEEEFSKAIQADSELPDRALGVMLRARLDPDHWLTAGAGESVNALVSGRAVFTPVKLDKGVNAAVFVAPDKLVASGYMWEETKKQFAYKPLVVAERQGRGQVIAFTADPNFRAYMDGLNVLFLNAVFRGPGRARSAGEEEF